MTTLRPFLFLLFAAALFSTRAADTAFFESKIRPALVEYCYKCHSAQSEKLKGGLHLDTREGLLQGGDTGPTIVPGDPDKSLLIRALRYKDEALQMPPKKRLPDVIVNDFVAWVKSGAPDPRGSETTVVKDAPKSNNYDFAVARASWAFRKPIDPPIPRVKNAKWIKTSIDPFILSKLESKGLAPTTAATKRQLIRRATFDLNGLPPTPAEIDAFLADNSPEAYPRLIDRLLDSPQYGERWARHWLDVVRYTDSLDSRGSGSEGDISEAYKYRDWVVQAFNNDLPFSDFIVQQFAGDLLPAPSGGFNTNGVIATGVMAIGEWGTGDADKDKMLTDIVDDQIDVTGRAFLGLTLACARCHDHKFDPIPTEDYYSLAGIFFSSHIVAKPGDKTAGTPVIRVPLAPGEELTRRKAREEKIAALDKELETLKDSYLNALATNAIEHAADYVQAARAKTKPARLDPRILDQWVQYLGFGDIALLSRPVSNVQGKEGLHAWIPPGKDNPSVTVNTTDHQIDFLTIKLPARTVAVHPSPADAIVVGWKAPGDGKFSFKGKVTDVDKECGNGIEWRLQTRGSTRRELASGAIENGGAKVFDEMHDLEIASGDFIELLVLPKGDYSCDSTAVELEIASAGRVWNLTKDLVANPHAGNPHSSVWYFYDGAGQRPPQDLPNESALAQWFANPNSETAAKVQAALQEQIGNSAARDEKSDFAKNNPDNKLFRLLINPRGAFWATLRRDLDNIPESDRAHARALAGELAQLRDNPPPPLPFAHALQEGGVPTSVHEGTKDAHIHIRGRYDRLGSVVPRRFPRLLAGDDRQPITEGSGRLQLARWLASADNPMTARVMVNRIWQHHFGEGIVRTPNNFGKLGTPPSHPELLDHLAHRFIESGWSIKAMHRLMMLSATYQQSSIPPAKTFAADPANELFGRMNRQRLEAEAIRDTLLATAGKLDLRNGGKSARELNMPRRTIYLTTIRSERSDYRALFDAADASAIVEKRITSTVAPQALFLLNNNFTLEQVKALTERMNREAPAEPERRVDWLYENLFGRPASKQEEKIARQFVDTTPESWEAYAQALLASNEFVYID
jgi:hypothetical protein